MKARVSRLRRAISVALPVCFAIALIAACGTDRPGASADGPAPALPDRCASPNDGCACATPGQTLDCGKVESRSGDHVVCSNGKRTCTAGRWSVCTSEFLTGPRYAPIVPVEVGTRALGAPGLCPPSGPTSNPCNPYCNQQIDDNALKEGGALF